MFSTSSIYTNSLEKQVKEISLDTESCEYTARLYDGNLSESFTEYPIKDGTNWYAYVGNDPINFTDPLGLCSEGAMDQDSAKSFVDKNLDILDSLNAKEPGESLTEEEANMQVALGSLETAGAVGLFGASIYFASPVGITYSTYLMADGTNRISQGLNEKKADNLIPSFISPVTQVGDETYVWLGL